MFSQETLLVNQKVTWVSSHRSGFSYEILFCLCRLPYLSDGEPTGDTPEKVKSHNKTFGGNQILTLSCRKPEMRVCSDCHTYDTASTTCACNLGHNHMCVQFGVLSQTLHPSCAVGTSLCISSFKPYLHCFYNAFTPQSKTYIATCSR